MRHLIRYIEHVAGWAGAHFWTTVAKAKLLLAGCRYGRGLRVTGPLRVSVHPEGRLRIGDNVTINAGWRHNPVGSSQFVTIWVSRGAELVIGDNVGMSHAEIVCTSGIRIGRGCKIGGGCCLYDSNFHSILSSQRAAAGNPGVESAPVILGDHVFLGAHCIVLKGVSIGDNSVIGAGSVVAKAIENNQVWAGSPARFLRNLP